MVKFVLPLSRVYEMGPRVNQMRDLANKLEQMRNYFYFAFLTVLHQETMKFMCCPCPQTLTVNVHGTKK